MEGRRPFALGLYRALSHVAGPALGLVLARRVKRKKEDPLRLGERRGYSQIARPEGTLVWIHAASVGEITRALPLVQRLREREVHVLVTTITVTSAQFATTRLPEGAIHQFVPLDLPSAVHRFLAHWQPNLALFMEQELWPNMLAGCRERSIPTVLVNARMSPRSFKRWQMAPRVVRHLLRHFDIVLAQSAHDGDRLSQLGAARAITVGNIKFDGPLLEADPQHLSALTLGFASRTVWTAASTHSGEDEMVLEAHALARQVVGRNLGLILAPRHPERGDLIAELCAMRGLSVVRRSGGLWPQETTDVFLLDTIGELGLAFEAGALAFLGGSLLAGIGGHNPIEAARLGRLVVHGPHVHNFIDVFKHLDESGGGISVTDASGLGTALCQFLPNTAEREQRARQGRLAVEALGGAINRVLLMIEPFLIQCRQDQRP